MASGVKKDRWSDKLKDNFKREYKKEVRQTLPLNCYAEVAASLKKVIHYSRCPKNNFSISDIIKFQNNKYFEINPFDIETCETYINSLTQEQNIIYYFDDCYDLDNENYYNEIFCCSLDKLCPAAKKYINNLYLSLTWFNDEIVILNSSEATKTKHAQKPHSKPLNYVLQYNNIMHKYSTFWNKSVFDLINLYNEYSNNNPMEGLIHGLVTLSSLINKEDMRSKLHKLIYRLYKENLNVLDLNVLKTLFICSQVVKSLIISDIGDIREFVIEKIIPNNKLKLMFFPPNIE